MADPTGAFAAEGQPDDVWFLAGTFGGKAKRSCHVPAGRPLFFPLVNICGPALLSGGRKLVVPSAVGGADLNGVPLPAVEVHNQRPFRLKPVKGSPMSIGVFRRARAWGLWTTIDGLEPGSYFLEIRGEFEPGGFWVAVDYSLTVG
ncbi:hypothetical protein ACIBG8_40000 [Nonomuraea sp. NPDC050556]|uniref:hypothetical protein n=1 Tax=Nonomuraea sp. NPDC050556 TaxID=3364369 RepID=UPI003787A933